MNSPTPGVGKVSISGWLLVALIVALPLMKPAVAYPLVASDLIFVLLAAALAFEVATQSYRFEWHASFAVLLIYWLGLAASLTASADMTASAFKLATQAYLVGLAAATILVARSQAMLRRLVLAWLAAAAVVAGLAIISLLAFLVAPAGGIYGYSHFHFGTLPPGDYPRLSLTFFNANMACNYLTASLGLLFVAWHQQWLSARASWALLIGIVAAAISTISPGLGGVALALGVGYWLLRGKRLALAAGALAAAAFLLAAAFTPFLHPTAPFVNELAGIGIAPSGRYLTWSAAWEEFRRYPFFGHGIGIDAVSVHYRDPSGNLQQLTDAHNVILSIAAQAGLAGLAGLAILIAYALKITFSQSTEPSRMLCLGIGITFLNVFLYQGLTGSFEDTRHLWVLFGLLVAAARLPVSPPDGRSRTAGAPSTG